MMLPSTISGCYVTVVCKRAHGLLRQEGKHSPLLTDDEMKDLVSNVNRRARRS
jgi:hypothetical protein